MTLTEKILARPWWSFAPLGLYCPVGNRQTWLGLGWEPPRLGLSFRGPFPKHCWGRVMGSKWPCVPLGAKSSQVRLPSGPDLWEEVTARSWCLGWARGV